MIIGKNTKITTATFVSTVDEDAGFYADNIIDQDSGTLYKVTEGTTVLTITLDSAIQAQYLALINMNIEDEIQIDLIDTSGPTTIASYTYDTDDLTGFNTLNLLVDNTAEATTDFDQIEITTNGTSTNFSTYIGYLWAGDAIDFGCVEAVQPSDNVTDSITISRANTPDAQERYKFQSFQVKTQKSEQFLTLRSNMRTLLTAGIGTPRPVWFPDETDFFGDVNIVYSILAINKASYDTFYIKDSNSTFKSQIPMEIQEVR